jgi:hypothetical protein
MEAKGDTPQAPAIAHVHHSIQVVDFDLGQ